MGFGSGLDVGVPVGVVGRRQGRDRDAFGLQSRFLGRHEDLAFMRTRSAMCCVATIEANSNHTWNG